MYMTLLLILLLFHRTSLIIKQYYSWDLLTGQFFPSSKIYCGHSISQKKTRCVFFKNFGDQTCPSFFLNTLWRSGSGTVSFHLQERKKQHPQSRLLSIQSVPPCSRWGCKQTFHQSFPSLVRLSLSLTDAGTLLVPCGSATEAGWRCTTGRPDGIPNWFSSIPTRPSIWFFPFLWCLPGCKRAVSRNVSRARTVRGSIHCTCACTPPWVQSWPQWRWSVIKGWTTTKMSLLSVTTPVYVRAKEGVEDRPARKNWFLSSSY